MAETNDEAILATLRSPKGRRVGRKQLLEAAQCDEPGSWREPTQAELSSGTAEPRDGDVFADVRDELRKSAEIREEEDDDSAWPRMKRAARFRRKRGNLSLSFRRRKRPELGNLASLQDSPRRNTDLGVSDRRSARSALSSAPTSAEGSSEIGSITCDDGTGSFLSMSTRKEPEITNRPVRRQSSLSRSFRKLRPLLRYGGGRGNSSEENQKEDARSGDENDIENRRDTEDTSTSSGKSLLGSNLTSRSQQRLHSQRRSAAAEERERINAMWMEVNRLRKLVVNERKAKIEILENVSSLQVCGRSLFYVSTCFTTISPVSMRFASYFEVICHR